MLRAHATLAGQSVDLSHADKSKALANALTRLAQRFGAQTPTNDDDPFARDGLGGGPASPASVLSPSRDGADADSGRGNRFESDLTDAEWARLAPLLPAPSSTGRHREADLREVVNALLHQFLRG